MAHPPRIIAGMLEKLVKGVTRLTGLPASCEMASRASLRRVHARKRRSLTKLRGRIRFDDDYDYKPMR